IGPNGAGKSTLLLHLNGLLGNDEPTVFVEGMAVAGKNLPEVRRRVGLLFQDANDQLFCPTVFEDVAFGPTQLGLGDEAVRERVRASLEKVGLAGFQERLPHHLSSGEKRRVCLAGVLACEPAILVLDEPTSSLDPKGRRELKELLRGIALPQLIATHDLELVAELCERVLVLDKGMIVASGRAVELLNDEDLMLRHGLERPHILR
ncbi:MAG: energy-coupling factor ABC transporter ATP-binding protein, partial [Phycisphaerales bacterium]|nr:energy-coupling factor ABC transporter ATP-binding protein [Phycisphaerales bacterium]